jgi:hypothetical protein
MPIARNRGSYRASPVGTKLPSTDEQPGPNDISERDLRRAPRFQALLQMATLDLALDHASLCSLLWHVSSPFPRPTAPLDYGAYQSL